MQHLLHITLSNAVLALIPAVAAVLAARWRCRPALVHGLWLLALAKLLTPPLVDVRLPVLKGEEQKEFPISDFESSIEDRGVGTAQHPIQPVGWGLPHRDVQTPPVMQSVGQAPPYALSTQHLLLIVWALGCAGVLAVALSRAWRFSRLLRHATPGSRVMRAQADQVAGRLGLDRSPPVVVVPGNVSPMLWAFGSQAKLVVPVDLWRRLSGLQQQALLAHELAHWRRRDHYVRYLELAATALYWWHPLVWWAKSRLREAEEQCCDAWVVWAWPEMAKEYATALVETVDFMSDDRVPALGSGMGTVQDLMQRVRMIMQDRTPRGLSAGGWLAVIAASALLPLLPRVVAADNEREDAPRRPVEERREGDAPREKEIKRDGEVKREGEPRRDGERREGEVRRDGERREGEAQRDGERRKEGGDGDRRQQRPINGRLIKIEGKSMFIAVGDAQREVVIPLEDDTKYWMGREDVTRDDLKPGMQVAVTMDDGLARHVRANPPRGEGRRDGEARKEGPRDGEKPREGEAREMRREGERGEARREGERRGEGERGDRRDDVPAGARRVNGEVVAVEGGNLLIQVGENRRELTVPIQAETQVLLNGQSIRASELPRGAQVTVIQVEGLTQTITGRFRQDAPRRAEGDR